MRTTKLGVFKRVLAFLIALAIILPSGFAGQTAKVYAGNTIPTAEPKLSQTNYRYLLVGESYDFNIRNKTKGYTYKWKSSNTKIATVNNTGLVKAKKAGKAKITCTVTTESGEYKLEAVVYVQKPTKNPADGIVINNKIDKLVIGETYDLNKDYLPDNASDRVNWTSSNTDIAVVDKNGKVTGLKEGVVTVTATTMMNKASDSVKIMVVNTAKVSTQKDLEKVLLTKAKVINIETKEEAEFRIPKGDYSDKKLIVDAPNSSISNFGLFKEVNIKSIKSDSWHEHAEGNTIIVSAKSSRVVIEKDAKASVYVDTSNNITIIEVYGETDIYIDTPGNIIIKGESGKVPNIHIRSEGVTITTDLALNIDASYKTTLELKTSEASNTVVTVSSEENIPNVKGNGSVKVNIAGTIKTVQGNVTSTGGGSTGGSSPAPVPTQSPVQEPTPIPKPEYIKATFGSPYVDGNIDDVWEKAEVYTCGQYSAKTDTTATHRIMWDDNALYILSVIKDSNLDDTNSASYEQDSLELFLDENYDKGTSYKSDDLHYRVSFRNKRSYDTGEPTRFYSRTQIIKENEKEVGYIVEACIVWADGTAPKNGKEMGFDIQINDANNGRRAAMLSIFDDTFNAWQNPSLFGKLILDGKKDGDVSGANPYRLLNYIESVKSIYLDAYINKDIIDEPLAHAEEVANNPASTQAEIDAAFRDLMDAVNKLDDGSGYVKPSALPEIKELPDIFTFRNGSKVTTLDEWKLRQEEISKLYQYYMYGVMPDKTGENISYELIDSYSYVMDFYGFKIPITKTRKQNQDFIKITVEKEGRTGTFIAEATYPAVTSTDSGGNEVITGKAVPIHQGGYPVLIVIGSVSDSVRNYLNSKGYAVIEFDNGSVAADNASRTGAFYDVYPYGKTWTEQTGVLMAWSWGVSKIIDVLELDFNTSDKKLDISPVNTMVTGISRNGKAAAVAGAFEPRIKITVPGCSGAGGMACFRYDSAGKVYDYSMLILEEFIDHQGVDTGTATWKSYQENPNHTVGNNEPLSNLQSPSEGHWFNDKFLEFTNRYQLPFDQYFLASLAATEGRYYLITGEIHEGDWTNPAAMYVTYLAAQRVFDSLGLSDNIGIRLHAVGHAFTLMDAKYLVEFANKHIYNQVDGAVDLNNLKTSIFEDPRNYDPYFDTLKNMQVPDLAGNKNIVIENFDNGIQNYMSVSGAAITIDTIESNNVLKVNKLEDDGYLSVSLVAASGSSIIKNPNTGTKASISINAMYNESTINPVEFIMELVEENGLNKTVTAVDIIKETNVGDNKNVWVKLNAQIILGRNDTYIIIKCLNAGTFYIDNIIITY